MVAANKLLHLLEAFSTPWFLFSAPQNHHLVFFLLEVFNNIIQYQFDGEMVTWTHQFDTVQDTGWKSEMSLTGNCNLVYAIIRKRNVFHQLANLPTDMASIQKALQKKKSGISRMNSTENVSMEGSSPAVPAEPGTLKASLEATPGRKSDHSNQRGFHCDHSRSKPTYWETILLIILARRSMSSWIQLQNGLELDEDNKQRTKVLCSCKVNKIWNQPHRNRIIRIWHKTSKRNGKQLLQEAKGTQNHQN